MIKYLISLFVWWWGEAKENTSWTKHFKTFHNPVQCERLTGLPVTFFCFPTYEGQKYAVAAQSNYTNTNTGEISHSPRGSSGLIYNTILGDFGQQLITQFTINYGSERCPRPEQGQTTTPGTTSPTLFEQWVGSLMSHTI